MHCTRVLVVCTLGSGLDFVYPRGATLNVQKPAVPILSSGYIAYPLNRPVGAVYTNKVRGGCCGIAGQGRGCGTVAGAAHRHVARPCAPRVCRE